jgi:hypothetical protein
VFRSGRSPPGLALSSQDLLAGGRTAPKTAHASGITTHFLKRGLTTNTDGLSTSCCGVVAAARATARPIVIASWCDA